MASEGQRDVLNEVLEALKLDPAAVDPDALDAARRLVNGDDELDPRALAARVSRLGGVSRSTRHGHGGVSYGKPIN